MNISDLGLIKKLIMSDLIKEGEKEQDEYRSGVGAGLTMALLKIDRLMESEEEALVREYEDFR